MAKATGYEACFHFKKLKVLPRDLHAVLIDLMQRHFELWPWVEKKFLIYKVLFLTATSSAYKV